MHSRSIHATYCARSFDSCLTDCAHKLVFNKAKGNCKVYKFNTLFRWMTDVLKLVPLDWICCSCSIGTLKFHAYKLLVRLL